MDADFCFWESIQNSNKIQQNIRHLISNVLNRESLISSINYKGIVTTLPIHPDVYSVDTDQIKKQSLNKGITYSLLVNANNAKHLLIAEK